MKKTVKKTKVAKKKATMSYRELYCDGCNGWRLGPIVSKAKALECSDGYSRNNDGLLEANNGEVMYVPLTGE